MYIQYAGISQIVLIIKIQFIIEIPASSCDTVIYTDHINLLADGIRLFRTARHFTRPVFRIAQVQDQRTFPCCGDLYGNSTCHSGQYKFPVFLCKSDGHFIGSGSAVTCLVIILISLSAQSDRCRTGRSGIENIVPSRIGAIKRHLAGDIPTHFQYRQINSRPTFTHSIDLCIITAARLGIPEVPATFFGRSQESRPVCRKISPYLSVTLFHKEVVPRSSADKSGIYPIRIWRSQCKTCLFFVLIQYKPDRHIDQIGRDIDFLYFAVYRFDVGGYASAQTEVDRSRHIGRKSQVLGDGIQLCTGISFRFAGTFGFNHVRRKIFLRR